MAGEGHGRRRTRSGGQGRRRTWLGRGMAGGGHGQGGRKEGKQVKGGRAVENLNYTGRARVKTRGYRASRWCNVQYICVMSLHPRESITVPVHKV